MPKQKQKNKQTRPSFVQRILNKQPILGYIALTLGLMGVLLMMEKGTEFYRASILQIPQFDGTVMPVESVPNWSTTGGYNTQKYHEYSKSEMIPLPEYNADELEEKCEQDVESYKNACITYSAVYMGNYKMDHKEYAGSHLAVDIRMPEGTPVYAVANGAVTIAERKNTGFGKYVVIKHPNAPLADGGTDTLYSAYAHLSQVSAEVGEVVTRGDIIGYSGNTGTSTTPHLHFQIDRSSAPWHPWWPFTTAQVYNAGFSFFEGINQGIGQEEAIKNTINPMPWVQKFRTKSAPIRVNSSGEEESPPELEKILVKLDPEEIQVGESTTLFLTVLDTDKKIFDAYTGANLQITASNKNVQMTQPRFTDGKAESIITPYETGTIGISVVDGNRANTVQLEVTQKEAEDIAPPDDTTRPDVNIPKSVEDPNAIASVSIESEEQFVLAGDNTKISVTILDKNGNVIRDPNFTDDLEVVLKGFGTIEPTTLKARYFTNGIARLNFFADEVPGRAEIFLEKFPNTKGAIDVVAKAEGVTGFEFEHDGGFQVGKREMVTIKTMDSNGNITPKSFPGTATLSIESGKAKLITETLTADDFTDGKAEAELIPLSKDPIIVHAKSGVLVGKSDRIREGEKEEIFSDIAPDHPNAKAIEYLKDKNILSGNPDGSFRPQGTINRAEFAKVILLALNIKPEPATGERFSDVPQDAWFATYAETAAKNGLIKGYPDGSFGPANTINRAELFTMLSRAAEQNEANGSAFADVPEGSWFAAAAEFAGENELLDFGSRFYPAQVMTRAEVAESVSRFLNL
jgi:hypothetical protein